MSEDKQTFGLQKNVNKAALVRAMCQTEGFKILQAEFTEKINKITKQILDINTTPEDIVKLRQKVQVWLEVQKALKQIMLTGEICKRSLDDNFDASLESSNKEK